MARARKKVNPPADVADVATDAVEQAAAEILPEKRPELPSAIDTAKAAEAGDWVTCRCIVGNVHTSIGKMYSGQVERLPPDEAKLLDEHDRIKILK